MVEATEASQKIDSENQGETAVATQQPEQPAHVDISKLEAPKSDIDRCHSNSDDLHGFGVFSYDQQENATHYNSYAQKYDGMQEMSGFNDPFEIVKQLVSKLGQPGQPLHSAEAKLLDFGCGTGLLGIELQKVGYRNIYGIDGSSEMLAIADAKGIYKWTWEVLVGTTPLPAGAMHVPDLSGAGFDAILSSACMIKGHFPNTCFEEMLKCLRPGGHMIFSIRDIYLDPSTDNGMNFTGKMAELEAAGKMIHVDTIHFTKYEGLQFGSGYQDEGANVKIFRKPAESSD